MILPTVKLANNSTNTTSAAVATTQTIRVVTTNTRDTTNDSLFIFTGLLLLSTFDRGNTHLLPKIMTTTIRTNNNTKLDDNDVALYDDAIILAIITIFGLFGNGLTVITVLSKKSLRNVTNMFLLHHCIINFLQSTLCIPFIIALLSNSVRLKGCEVFGGAYVTIVTTGILNIAAMAAAEAYHFEDIISNDDRKHELSYTLKMRERRAALMPKESIADSSDVASSKTKRKILLVNKTSNTSCPCVVFGVIMIWLASIILHLGITLIGSDPKQFYNHAIRNCFFIIGDKRTYILYIMWIVVTLMSLVLIIKYVIKIYKDILKHKKLTASSSLKLNSIISRNQDIDFSYFLLKNRFNNNNNSNVNKTGTLIENNLLRVKRANFKQKTNSLPMAHSISYNLDSISRSRRNLLKPKSLSFSLTHLSNVNLTHSNSNGSTKHQNKLTKYNNQQQKLKYKRNYDVIKQVLQKIKIQFIVVLFFIICWLPLFVTVIIDSKFEVSPTAYRYLTIIACSNSSITPYCYLTILIPKINKFCLPCLRTDGKRSKRKSKLYDAMTNYYNKVGDRFHNCNASTNSLNSIHSNYTVNNLNVIKSNEQVYRDDINLIQTFPLKDSITSYDNARNSITKVLNNKNHKLTKGDSNSEFYNETSFM